MKNKVILSLLVKLFRKQAGRSLLFSGIAWLFAATAFAQQIYTFTPCNATGRYGPTQGQVNTAYSTTNLNGNVTINTQGVQEWVVPASGAYAIAAYGGQGCGPYGGRGAQMIGEFQLTAGQVLRIVVGQQSLLPANASYNAQFGGGGGSFVTDNTNTPFVVAGGGGGNWANNYSSAADAPTTTNGNSGAASAATPGAGGTAGGGGGTDTSADGGGGLTGNGSGTAPGISYVNGATGGFSTYAEGGFGGGGGTSSYNDRRCAGGGGYSGGGGSHVSGTAGNPEGGGGGSYNNGTNQNNVAGANTGDGKVVITKLCNVTVAASTNPICYGQTIALSTNAAGTITWSPSGASTSNSIAISPTVTSSFSVSGTGTPNNCIGTAVITITVLPLPNVSAAKNPNILCAGKTATLTGLGAISYTWSNSLSGSTTTVSPTSNSVFTVNGTSALGCVNSQTFVVSVNSNSLTVSPDITICEGSPGNLSATGALTYTWSSGLQFQSIQVYPTSSTVYSVVGLDAMGCRISNTVMVNVNGRPNVTAGADNNVICLGQTINLDAQGATTYTWSSNGGSNASLALTPQIDVPYSYTVTGTNGDGCSNTAVVSFTVDRCVGIDEQAAANAVTSLFPNPTQGQVTLAFSTALPRTIEVLDVTGRLMTSDTYATQQVKLDLSNYASGVYYLKIRSGQSVQTQKLIRQ